MSGVPTPLVPSPAPMVISASAAVVSARFDAPTSTIVVTLHPVARGWFGAGGGTVEVRVNG